MQATPTKLRNGNWGAKVQGTATEGSTITITTKKGKSWTATVSKVIWTGNGVSIVATDSVGRSSGRRGYRRGDGGPRGSRACYMCGSYYCDGARGGLCEDD